MIRYQKSILEKACDFLNKDHVNKKCLTNVPITIMCSSGVDSVSATDFLLKNLRTNTKIMVLHYNHNIREQNDLMESTVHKFLCERHPNAGYIMHGRKGVLNNITEEKLRSARISDINKILYNNLIITAHHLDDCVESYLMNVFRGNEGFLPMPFFTYYNDSKNVFAKPFIFNRKKDFIKYAEENDLMKYVVEDSTNKISKGSRRNLIRNEIVPILNKNFMGIHKIVEKKLKQRLMLELI